MHPLLIIGLCWAAFALLLATGNYFYWRMYPDKEDNTNY